MIATVADVTLRELSRRGWALAMVVGLPLLLLRMGPVQYRTSFLIVGAGWAMATLSLFSHVAGLPVERRLSVIGAHRTALHLGRQFALSAIGMGVAAVAWLAAWTGGTPRPGVTAVALVASVLVGVPLGALVAQLLPREMDGTLVMIAVLAITLTARAQWTHYLPFWSAQEFLGEAADFGRDPQVLAGLRHAGAALVLLSTAAWLAHRTRLARG